MIPEAENSILVKEINPTTLNDIHNDKLKFVCTTTTHAHYSHTYRAFER